MQIFHKVSWLRPKQWSRLCAIRAHKSLSGNEEELTDSLKKSIETFWMPQVSHGDFDPSSSKNKFYVLSMFPYPSGNLHMGHVRVYTISDTMARFYRMNGKNVFHPIGWDSFGLPAENAALQRKIEPLKWTKLNISQMKKQLVSLGLSFDWENEISTCDPEYFKWTQALFIRLLNEGLIYRKHAIVNWDPVDQTVLADEQVDANGNSWRSGAKVEKILLKQWFIRTAKFAKNLLEGLSSPCLQDWRDIIKLQRNWIGLCNGWAFDLNLCSDEHDESYQEITLRVWTQHPEKLKDPGAFVIAKTNWSLEQSLKSSDKLRIFNPFTKIDMPLVFFDDFEYAEGVDLHVMSPNGSDQDRSFALENRIPFEQFDYDSTVSEEHRNDVINFAISLGIGGYEVSSKLQDWAISRQRHWGTPIPIIYCNECGAVPVREENLPFVPNDKNVVCPSCGSCNVNVETDTMDTFFDSSWYFLRYLDPRNDKQLFDKDKVKGFMPVDLYIGGKEHAVLHLYYARFINHFLHSQGLVQDPEPFNKLLVQGMIMGQTYRVKKTGQYLHKNEVEFKGKKATQKLTGQDVSVTWEKMSKSKLNGVDPSDMIAEFGCDSTRLIILGDVAPTSHRNWSSATYPGILKWQARIWSTVNEFIELRQNTGLMNEHNSDTLREEENKMFDARNYYVKGTTFCYKYTHQLSVAISKMQGLTNSLRRCPKDVRPLSKQYERALSCLIIMLAPMAPHFASELWSKFLSAPNRLNVQSPDIQWDKNVLKQHWPVVDVNYNLELTVKVNGFDALSLKLPKDELDNLKCDKAMSMPVCQEAVKNSVKGRTINNVIYEHYPGCGAVINIFTNRSKVVENSS